MSSGVLQVSTVTEKRSALKDLNRQKLLNIVARYLDDLKTFLKGMKRFKADNDHAVNEHKPGMEPLPISQYTQFADCTLILSSFRMSQRNRILPFELTFCIFNGPIVSVVYVSKRSQLKKETLLKTLDTLAHIQLIQ
ncbi:hypothetical protein GN244_ATG18549 [Phytophthora infestans]|uniref:Uncharacterized protein n=1 Tax=Phytophthora infestans TaxID=4787 RepID=A0A833RPF2_PHYIN|nr:hypothetical protein GN244_ATG18549 [Phytophthora infestans]